MGNPVGFLEVRERQLPSRRPVEERVKDWKEIYKPFPEETLQKQASRCMDCGVPFCHNGCPLGNIIPEWNDLVYKDRWREAIISLHHTNNFPEFTGRLCPAPCESSCVLGISEPAVTIRQIELSVSERAWSEGWIQPQPAANKTGKSIGIIGSGPAGLACAQQLARAGHAVTVYERSDRIGGLMVYGIPEFKMEKRFISRRIQQMEMEGVRFVRNAHIGVNIEAGKLQSEHDALVLCAGASQPRDLKVPGRELDGVHFAVPYLTQANKVAMGDVVPNQITAKDKRIIILGGGDTGADCVGTAVRQNAKSIRQFELMPCPPRERASDNPWPQWSQIWRSSSAHEECEARDYNIETVRLSGSNGVLTELHARRLEWSKGEDGRMKPKPVPGSEWSEPADLVLLAMGFVGAERGGLLEQLNVKLTDRGNVWTQDDKMTSVPGVFAAGDMARGQSLIVWAIAEGRAAARGVDRFLMGETTLRSPI